MGATAVHVWYRLLHQEEDADEAFFRHLEGALHASNVSSSAAL